MPGWQEHDFPTLFPTFLEQHRDEQEVVAKLPSGDSDIFAFHYSVSHFNEISIKYSSDDRILI